MAVLSQHPMGGATPFFLVLDDPRAPLQYPAYDDDPWTVLPVSDVSSVPHLLTSPDVPPGPPPATPPDVPGPPPASSTDVLGPPPASSTDVLGPPPAASTDVPGSPPAASTDVPGSPPADVEIASSLSFLGRF